MKITLKLVFSLVLVVVVVALVFSYWQASLVEPERVQQIWITGFWRAFVQALFVALTALVVIYLNVMAPIRKTTEWIKGVRLGEPVTKLKGLHKTILGPLAHEITRMVRSLENARSAAEEEARLRQTTESVWTKERLKNL